MNILELYRQAGAYHEGHFLLASGRHSPKFLQSTTVLQHPQYADAIGALLADKLRDLEPSFVIGPAMGGVVLAYVTARGLGCRALFAEKAQGEGGHKIMTVREAFSIAPGERFVAVEDVLTTGGSVLRAVKAVQEKGGQCVGIGCVIDRREFDTALEGIPLRSLERLYFETYAPDGVPASLAALPLQEI